MVLALVAVTVPKVWAVGVDGRTWAMAWAGGLVGGALFAALCWTYGARRGILDAAIEIDVRCGLKERVSSVLALTPEELQTEAGKALLADAERRAEHIELREYFPTTVTWYSLFPAAVAVVVFFMAFSVRDVASTQAEASATDAASSEQVRRSIEELKRRLAERRKLTETSESPDAHAVLVKLQEAVDQMAKSDVDRRHALVELNNLSKQLAERRLQTESVEKVRDQLRQLSGFEEGPAERIANAMKAGDMQQALEELSRLNDRLRDGTLTDQEKQELIKQLRQLSGELEKMLAAKRDLEQKKRELESRVEELKREGDLATAGQLQEKLDQIQQSLDAMEQQNPQLRQLAEMANCLRECADSMPRGAENEATDELDRLAESLRQMQSELDDLEATDELMEEIASAKSALSCKSCGGKGCDECQAAAMGLQGNGMFSTQPGRGLGDGQGVGDRPEEETETAASEARVRGKPGKGEAVRVGNAGGANVAGDTRESIHEEMASPVSEDADPVSYEELPRRERNQAREYFESLRKGE